jgi:hypothetical protein
MIIRIDKTYVSTINVLTVSPNFKKLNSAASVRERTIPVERLPLVEVSANFGG